MPTILDVLITTDFGVAPNNGFNDVGTIDFDNTSGSVTATFLNTQFNGVKILNNVLFQGTVFGNQIVVNGGSVNASGWTFSTTGWTASDTITLNGGSSDDTIVGSARRDTINGGGGDDNITGGLGADILAGGGGSTDMYIYTSTAEMVVGETITGSAGGSDFVIIEGNGAYDLSILTMTNVDGVGISNGIAATVAFTSAHLAGFDTLGTGFDGVVQQFNITGSSISLANIYTEGESLDVINLIGDGVNGTFNTNSLASFFPIGNYTILGGGGADTLIGGLFSDTFRYLDASELAAGETIDGGTGAFADAISFEGGGTYSLPAYSIINVETLKFNGAGAQVIVNASQLGGTGFTTISGGTAADTLTVNGANASLAGITFIEPSNVSITLNGVAGHDTMSSGAKAATFVGGGGADAMSGGGGSVFVLNSVAEYATGETISGSATGTTEVIKLQGNGSYLLGTGLSTIANIDAIEFASLGSTEAVLTANNILTDLATQNGTRIKTVIGGGGFDTFRVAGANADLSKLTFLNWTEGVDVVRLSGAFSLTGTAQRDLIFGEGSDNVIRGGAGADELSGAAGNDTFVINAGDLAAGEVISGGADTGTGLRDVLSLVAPGVGGVFDFTNVTLSGLETLILSGGDLEAIFKDLDIGGPDGIKTVTGHASLDKIVINTANADLSAVTFNTWTDGTDIIQINGVSAADVIVGSARNDVITGGAGGDDLSGGNGDDTFVYASGSEFAAGEDVNGGNGALDSLRVGAGTFNFTLAGTTVTGVERLSFTDGLASTVTLAAPIALVAGGAGAQNTLIIQGSSVDTSGIVFDANWQTSGPAGDRLILRGTGGADTLTGGATDETLEGGGGADALDGAGGADTASYFSDGAVKTSLDATITRTGAAAGDTYALIENLAGSEAGADTLGGNAGANSLSGHGGDDSLHGRAGADTLDGGAGSDFASYYYDGLVITALDGSLAKTGAALGDTYNSIENFSGSNTGGDTLAGDAGANKIYGNGGNDTLQGRAGADTLRGGLGVDTLSGQEGADTFQYLSASEGGDVITSFSSIDFFAFKGAAFGALPLGTLAAARFQSRAVDNFAQDADDHFIFREDTDTLWYDATGGNGTAAGAADAVLIADITANAAVTAGDIVIF